MEVEVELEVEVEGGGGGGDLRQAVLGSRAVQIFFFACWRQETMKEKKTEE